MTVGSTNTIVYFMYKENNVEIPKEIAGIMLSGLLSDTLCLQSPTTTEIDKKVAEDLALIAGVDYKKYALDMFKAGTSLEGLTKEEVIKSDFKSFPIGDEKMAIGQVFTLDVDRIFDELDTYIEKLEEINNKEGYKFIIIAITDILKNGSYLIFTENAKSVLESIYKLDDIKQGYYVDGLVSRKKQILPAILSELAENGKIHDYTRKYLQQVLFEKSDMIIESSPKWTNERIDWTDETKDTEFRKMQNEIHGFEILQGAGVVKGELLGGCLDVMPMIVGTEIWPKLDEWENKILFIETSEEKPSPDNVKYILRNLVAIGIIDKINGIIVGKPKGEIYYDEYKKIFHDVINIEAKKNKLPIIYNVNFGHSAPMCILPYGATAILDLENKKIIISNY